MRPFASRQIQRQKICEDSVAASFLNMKIRNPLETSQEACPYHNLLMGDGKKHRTDEKNNFKTKTRLRTSHGSAVIHGFVWGWFLKQFFVDKCHGIPIFDNICMYGNGSRRVPIFYVWGGMYGNQKFWPSVPVFWFWKLPKYQVLLKMPGMKLIVMARC